MIIRTDLNVSVEPMIFVFSVNAWCDSFCLPPIGAVHYKNL